jgi:outer membrane protein TolC
MTPRTCRSLPSSLRSLGAGASLGMTMVSVAAPVALTAQDSLRLSALHADALGLDPRQRQIALQAAATEVRLRTIGADARPAFVVDGRAQYQSEVTRFPGGGAFSPPTPPHDTYDAHVLARQSLFDPTLGARRAVERAQLGEAQAQVRTTLFALRHEINEAFFTAASLQERIATIDVAIADLAARLRDTRQRFAAGAALPGDTATLAATILQREQDRLRLSADRAAALARLSALVGRDVSRTPALVAPDLRDRVERTVAALDALRQRPEYAQFDATRERLSRQEAATSAQRKPRISAFGQAGVGKPGLNALGQDFQSYWLGGVQLQWAPWNWGSTSRERELLQIQREIVATNEAAFTAGMRRGLEQSLASISQLDSTLALDDRVVALREVVEREAAAKLREGAITAAEYVDRNMELLSARVARIQHRVELAFARATFLTTLGVELP